MADIVEWEWRRENAEDHESLDSREVHGVYAHGRLWAVVALTDDADGETWMYYTAPDPEDAWNGYESIDTFTTLDAAKESIDGSRDEVLRLIRESAPE